MRYHWKERYISFDSSGSMSWNFKRLIQNHENKGSAFFAQKLLKHFFMIVSCNPKNRSHGCELSNETSIKQTKGGTGQLGCESKWIILSKLKTSLGQSGYGSGWVDSYFSHEFFFFKKTTCICH